jgi:uncharacterized membrane protein
MKLSLRTARWSPGRRLAISLARGSKIRSTWTMSKERLAMPLAPLYLVTALATALMAGFFWSFSVVVMDGLRLLPPLEGMRAMQAINAAVRNLLFGLGFFGTPMLCTLVLLSLVLTAGRGTGGVVAASGAALYLALALVVTFARNIPLNEALAAATSAEQWHAFLGPWVFWNHVRTVGSLAAACLLALGYALDQRA